MSDLFSGIMPSSSAVCTPETARKCMAGATASDCPNPPMQQSWMGQEAISMASSMGLSAWEMEMGDNLPGSIWPHVFWPVCFARQYCAPVGQSEYAIASSMSVSAADVDTRAPPPPTPPPPPPPPPPPTPGSNGTQAPPTASSPSPKAKGSATVVLTLTASGSVSDFSDTSSLQQKIATAAGVDTIRVAAASVIITATIAVPAGTTAVAVQGTLSSSLGTAAAASELLGITVESAPTTVSTEAPQESTEESSDSGNVVVIVGAAADGLAFVLLMIGIAVCAVKKMKKQPNNEAGTKQVAMTTASQQIEVTVTQPESKKAAAPESLAALLAACGLQHHEKTFKDQGYTLDTLLSSMKQGEAVVKSDLRELKLTLGECRQLINQLSREPASKMLLHATL